MNFEHNILDYLVTLHSLIGQKFMIQSQQNMKTNSEFMARFCYLLLNFNYFIIKGLKSKIKLIVGLFGNQNMQFHSLIGTCNKYLLVTKILI